MTHHPKIFNIGQPVDENLKLFTCSVSRTPTQKKLGADLDGKNG